MDKNTPFYYQNKAGTRDVFDMMREFMGDEAFQNFCVGSILKYTVRAGRKSTDQEGDWHKVKHYAEVLFQMHREKTLTPKPLTSYQKDLETTALSEQTGLSAITCRAALEEAKWDYTKAYNLIAEKASGEHHQTGVPSYFAQEHPEAPVEAFQPPTTLEQVEAHRLLAEVEANAPAEAFIPCAQLESLDALPETPHNEASEEVDNVSANKRPTNILANQSAQQRACRGSQGT